MNGWRKIPIVALLASPTTRGSEVTFSLLKRQMLNISTHLICWTLLIMVALMIGFAFAAYAEALFGGKA